MSRNQYITIVFMLYSVIIVPYVFGDNQNGDMVLKLLSPGRKNQEDAAKKILEIGESVTPYLDMAFDGADMSGKKRIIDVLKKLHGIESKEALINILKRINEHPLSGDTWQNIPKEEFLQKQIAFAFKEAGEKGLSVLKKNVQKAEGEFKKRIIIAIGLLGDSSYYDEIVNFIEKDANPYIRELSVFAIGKIGKKKAIPVLERALKDEFYYEQVKSNGGTDIVWPEEYPAAKYYPVREAAVHAIQDIGGEIEREGWNIRIKKDSIK